MIQAFTEPATMLKVWSREFTPADMPLLSQMQRLLGEVALRQLGIYQLPEDFKLSVAMPVYNERATIQEIIRRVRAVPLQKEIIIVDDGSTDGTRDVLRAMEGEPGLRILYHKRNAGKGAALRTAFR